MPHRTHRPDGNRGEIIEALEARGWTVLNTGGVGEGFPDCLAIKFGRDGYYLDLGKIRNRIT